MDAKSLVLLIVQVSLVLLIAGIGLQSRWSDLLSAVRQPAMLLRAILAVNIVVPAVALLTVAFLPIEPAVRVGIVIMAVSPMAPFVPGKMLKAGADVSHVLGLYVALVVAAVLLVPATIALLSAVSPQEASIPVWEVARFLLTSILLPLGAGLLIGTIFPAWAPRLARIANLIALAILLPFVLLLLYKAGGPIVSLIGNGVLAAIVVTVLAGLAAGHLLGGPDPSHRAALAGAAATRHPGIAGLIAQRHFEDQRVMLAVVLFLLTSMVVSALYSAMAAKRRGKPAQVRGSA